MYIWKIIKYISQTSFLNHCFVSLTLIPCSYLFLIGKGATPAGSEDEEESYYGIEDDEGVDGIAEWQHQNHHTNASTPVGLSNSDGGLRSSSLVASPLPVVFTDPDLLDCPICLEPLCAPIYQVIN